MPWWQSNEEGGSRKKTSQGCFFPRGYIIAFNKQIKSSQTSQTEKTMKPCLTQAYTLSCVNFATNIISAKPNAIDKKVSPNIREQSK